ncbi:hypothetical protein [Acidihalobacter yilgarnensis]|nr:hypothetical protein [Acidihalobacter yilgarnensis]
MGSGLPASDESTAKLKEDACASQTLLPQLRCMVVGNMSDASMISIVPPSQDKKIQVIVRIEPGCLGATGAEHIDAFCRFAETEFEIVDPGFTCWTFLPRNDKSLAEIEYQLTNKRLNRAQAFQYLSVFGKQLEDFEEQLHLHLADLIDRYRSR